MGRLLALVQRPGSAVAMHMPRAVRHGTRECVSIRGADQAVACGQELAPDCAVDHSLAAVEGLEDLGELWGVLGVLSGDLGELWGGQEVLGVLHSMLMS